MLAVDHALREQVDSALVARGYVQRQDMAQFELDYRIGDTASAGQAGPSWPLSPREEYQRIMAGPNAEYEVSSRFYTHQTLGYHEVHSIKLTVYDIASSRIVWESTASKLVDDPGASPEKVGQIVAKSTRKIIRNFPGVAAERN
jgi:hypothetical protein